MEYLLAGYPTKYSSYPVQDSAKITVEKEVQTWDGERMIALSIDIQSDSPVLIVSYQFTIRNKSRGFGRNVHTAQIKQYSHLKTELYSTLK